MTPEERLKNQRENQNYFSEKISELSRYIGFALAALGFAIVSDEATLFASLPTDGQNALIAATFLGCVTVLLDYAQYAFGWFSASSAARNKANDYRLEGLGTLFRFLQTVSFYLKQLSASIGAVLIVLVLGGLVFSQSSGLSSSDAEQPSEPRSDDNVVDFPRSQTSP